MFATRLLCASTIMVFALTTIPVEGQRSPYAGSRPGGLNQKDKYHINSNNNASTDIASRFGAPENNVPFGTAQRPPVGLPVVMPEGSFTPLQPTFVDGPLTPAIGGANFLPAVAAAGVDSNGIAFSNRLGETTTNTQNTAPGLAGVPPPQTQVPFFPQQAQMPLTPQQIPQVPSAQPLPQAQPQPQAPAPLPLDAHGDQELINQLSLLPEDRRPFWFLNYQAIEAQRNGSMGFNSGIVQTRGSFAG